MISWGVWIGVSAVATGQSPSVSNQAEKTIYLQKPAQGIVQTQAIAPPAPPPIFTPLPAPQLQPLAPLPAASTPGLQFVQKEEPKSATSVDAVQAVPSQPVNLDPPKRADVFRFDDDQTLKTRVRSEIATTKGLKELKLPESTGAVSGQAPPRTMPAMQVLIEPAYVNHRRLFFEQKNTERAGWDWGFAQPVVSTLHFYKDCAFWPHKLASGLMAPYETSAGKCLPGAPTPLLLYPPEITTFGGVVGAGAIVGVAAILP